MSSTSNNDRRNYLMKSIEILRACQATCQKAVEFDIDTFFRLKAKQDAIFAELACIDHPELKGRTCPLCEETFDGYGNNPAPIEVEGQVCDDCNANCVIPARFREMRQ